MSMMYSSSVALQTGKKSDAAIAMIKNQPALHIHKFIKWLFLVDALDSRHDTVRLVNRNRLHSAGSSSTATAFDDKRVERQ